MASREWVFYDNRSFPYRVNEVGGPLRDRSGAEYWRRRGVHLLVWHSNGLEEKRMREELESNGFPLILLAWGANGRRLNDARTIRDRLQSIRDGLPSLADKPLAVLPVAHTKPGVNEWTILLEWLEISCAVPEVLINSAEAFQAELFKRAEGDWNVAKLLGLPSSEMEVRELAALRLAGLFLTDKPHLDLHSDRALNIYSSKSWPAEIRDAAGDELRSFSSRSD